jgi:hypothetical protein
MSRGPGQIERAVKAVFDAEPRQVFTTDDLCARVYRGATVIEKKHRVSVIRAARRVIQRDAEWRMVRSRQFPGAPFAFFRRSPAGEDGTAAQHEDDATSANRFRSPLPD